MYNGFQLCGSSQPIAVEGAPYKAGRRHLGVILPDRAWVMSLPGALYFRFHLVAGRLTAASLVSCCPSSCFILVILFQRLAWVLLLAACCSICLQEITAALPRCFASLCCLIAIALNYCLALIRRFTLALWLFWSLQVNFI